MADRQTNLRQLVVELDPDWVRDSRVRPEYRFSGGKTAEGRTFMADYQKRGAYHDPAPEESE